MKNKKILFSVTVVLVITWVVAFIYEPKLPEQVPNHWNINGEVDGYMSKPWGVYLLPFISTVMSILLFFLPAISPKGFKLDAAKKVYEIIILVMTVFMLGIMVLTFEAGLNNEIDMNQWVLIAMGLLYIIIGNYISKVPKNFFMGIRTPWTLASDKVWYKTHRLGSWTFVFAGVISLLGGILQWSLSWLIAALIAAAVIPVIYSLVIYKNIEGFKEQ
jgi:uncharacterized membrane protein